MKFGGYPAAAELIGKPERWQSFIRDSIIEPVLGRDLQTQIEIQKPSLLRQLFELAMRYPAQEISYQKLLGQLQDHGNAATIKHYLEVLEGGFLLQKLEKFSSEPLRQKSSSPKILPLAPALIHAFTNPTEIDTSPEWFGRVFEAAVGAHLARLPGKLFYWRQHPYEVDYVYVEDNKVYAIEVKSGRKKKDAGLIQFKALFPKAHCVLVDLELGKRFLEASASIKTLF